jgi:hypothetical protein
MVKELLPGAMDVSMRVSMSTIRNKDMGCLVGQIIGSIREIG